MMQCRRNGRQSINLILDLTILINIGRQRINSLQGFKPIVQPSMSCHKKIPEIQRENNSQILEFWGSLNSVY